MGEHRGQDVAQLLAKEHRTVSRVTTILELVAAERSGLRLGALAEALDAPKSSIFGLVKGLVSSGYLTENDGRYALGPALAHLLTVGPRPVLAEALQPMLDQLRDLFDETVSLGTLVGGSVVYVAVAESAQVIRYSPPLRHRRPLYPPSAGKVFLAHWPDRRRQAYLEAHVPASLRAEAEQELARIRTEGVAYNHGETVPDLTAAAAPVTVNDRVAAAIAIAGPSSRVEPVLDEMSVALRDVVTEAGRLLL